MKMAYYNENNKYAAQWLRNLITKGLIAPGEVDERSIKEISPADLNGYSQCHFFAGIGGWSYALRLAGWSDDRPVWTGSCPCQPYSSQGKGARQSDERHLWPDWFRLIREQSPTVVFGEQVIDAVAAGWLDEVMLNMEDIGYACAAAGLPACAASAPHHRKRIWFVCGNTTGNRPATEQNESVRQDAWTGRIRNESNRWARTGYKPDFPLLANGVPNRMGRLRAFGNAIVPQIAAEFIAAYDEI